MYQVSEKGGAATLVTSIDTEHRQIGHRWPLFVDARHFVFTGQGPGETSGIYLGTIGSLETIRLVGVYSNSACVDGRLLFVNNGMIVAQALDVANRRLTGEAREIAGPVAFFGGLGFESFSTSSNGVLGYIAGSGAARTEMRWFDRKGKPLDLLGQGTDLPRYDSYFQQLSPDGHTLVFSAFRSSTADLWLVDTKRDVPSRFTFGDASEINPVWSFDGTQMLFASNNNGTYNVYRKPLSGRGPEEPLLRATSNQRFPTDWSQDGRTILTFIDTSIGSFHSMHYALTADGERFLLNVSAVSENPTTVVLNWRQALRP